MRTIVTIVTLVSVTIGLIGLIVKAIWFRVDYGHVGVMMRNQQVKLDKDGEPIIKEPGWRSQFPIRDDCKMVNCMVRTSELKPQDLTAGDGKNVIHATAKWYVLSLRNGKKFRTYPARTLLVEDLNQEVEEILRDAIREVMATSETAASQWQSKKLTKEVKKLVKNDVSLIGVRIRKIRLPEAAQSEGTAEGNLIKQGFEILAGKAPAELSDEPGTYEGYPPPLHGVPS